MKLDTNTILVIAVAGLAGYFIYTYAKRGAAASATTVQGTGNSVAAATNNGSGGSGSFWDTLGNVGKGLNSGVSSVESGYNSIYDLFGGSDTTAGNPQPVVG